MSGTQPDTAAGHGEPVVSILLSLGLALSRRGRHTEAVDALRKALAEPDDKPLGAIATALLDALLAKDDRAGALKTGLELAARVPAAVAPALQRLVPVLRRSLLRPVAEELAAVEWLPLVTSSDLDPSIRRGLVKFVGRAYLVLGDADRATALLEGSAEIVDGEPELLLLLADSRLQTWQPERAEQVLVRAAETAGPDLAGEITLRLARLYEESGQPAKALARLRDIPVDRAEVGAELYALKALALLDLGDLAAAGEASQAALALAPNSPAAAGAGTCVCLAEQAYEQAKATADAGLARNPQHHGLSFLRFQAIVESGQELAQIDRRLARFLGRMAPAEIDQCAKRSERTRSADDPAVHYFLGMLWRASDRPQDALRAVDTAIRLLGDQPVTPPGVAPLAHRLRAILLAPDDPVGSAQAYSTAGLLAFEQMNYDLSADLLTEAGKNQDLSQVARWTLAEALFIGSYVPTEPKGVSVEKIQRAVEVWQQAMDRGLPEYDEVWAYVSKARMCLQLARLAADPYRLITEALLWCECFAVCSPATDAYLDAYGQACRLLGLYGLQMEVLAGVVGPPAARSVEPMPLENLMTCAANAGDLDRMRRTAPVYGFFAVNTVWREYEARYLQLNDEPIAALASLDEVAAEDRSPLYHLWLRLLIQWSAGDQAAVDATLDRCGEVAAQEVGGHSGLKAWLVLLSGDRERAMDLFAGFTSAESWSTDVAAELALCRLAGHEPAAEAEVRRYLVETRSFEDTHDSATLLGLLAKRYGETPDGAFARLRAVVADRLAAGGWPLTPAGDVDHLLATAAGRTDADHVPIVELATRARLAVTNQRWSDAIASYRGLIPHLDMFPEVESAFTWLAGALAGRPAAEITGLAGELADAIAELRRHGSRRVSPLQPEIVLGDTCLALADTEQARALFESVVDFPEPVGENRAHALARLHVLAAVQGRPDADELLVRALRSYQDAGAPAAESVYQNSLLAARGLAQWQQVIEVWDRTAGSHDFADELSLAGRRGLAAMYADAGQLAQAEVAYRDVVSALTSTAGPDHPETLACRHELGRTLQAQEKWADAETEHRAVIEARTRLLGELDTATLSSHWDLAWVLYNSGDLPAAEQEYRTLITGMRQVGANDADVRLARYELGLLLASLEDYPGARTEFLAAAEGREATLGPDDPTAIAARFQAAVLVRLMGDPVEAAAQLAVVLARQRTVFGEDHPDTLASRHQLGMTMVERGDHAAAAAEYREVAAGRARVMGELDISTISTRRELASALLAIGDFAGAVAEYQAVASARTQVFGDDAPATLSARRDVAFARYSQGDYAASAQEYRSVVAGMRAVSGDDDPETVGTWHDWALLLYLLDDGEASARELRTVLAKMITLNGEDNPDTLAVRQELAHSLAIAGDLAGADEQYRAAVAGWSRTSGVDDPATLSARAELAGHLVAADRATEAEAEYLAVARARARVLGEHDPATLDARWELAWLLSVRGEWAAAEAEYRQVLAGYIARQDPAEPEARSRIGVMLRQQERFTEALTEFDTALAAQVAASGELHAETLDARLEIARTRAAMSEWDTAAVQLRAVVADCTQTVGPDAPATLAARYELATVLNAQQDATAAEAEFRAVAQAWERVAGPDHRDALVSRYFVAKTLAAQGRWAEADAAYRLVLEREIRVQGAEDPSTLITRHQLAGVLIELGDLEAAEQEARAVTEARSRVLGAEDPATLMSRQRLAFVLRDRGKLAEAEAEYRTVLSGMERVFAPDDSGTLTTRHQLGGLCRQLGNLPAAEAEFRAVLAGLGRTVGADHPMTFEVRLDLGVVLYERGEFDAAFDALRAVVADMSQALGADDAATLSARAELARFLAEVGRPAEAEVEYLAVVRAWERIAGPDHPNAVLNRYHLGRVHSEQGRWAEAEAEYRTVLERETRLQGADDPSTLITRHYLAVALAARKDFTAAAAEFRAVVAARTEALGEHDVDTLASRRGLAHALAELGELAAAVTEYRAAAAGYTETLGPDDRTTLIVRGELARALHEMADLPAAEHERRDLVTTWQRLAGPDSPDALLDRFHLATVLADQGRYADAEVEFRATLEGEIRAQGAAHPSTLITHHRLAVVLAELGRLDDAEAELRTVLVARTEVLGPDDRATLSSRRELGLVLRDRGELAAAEAEFLAVVALAGADSVDGLAARYYLATVLAARERWADAETELRAVLAGETRALGAEGPSTLVTRHQLAAVIAAQGRIEEAEAEYLDLIAIRTRVLGEDDPATQASKAALERLRA